MPGEGFDSDPVPGVDPSPPSIPPELHARAEGVHLPVEVLCGLRQHQVGVQAGMPDAAQAQGHLLHQVVNWVPLHVRPLVGVEVDALLGHGQDAQAGAPQPRDGHQVVGPDGVAWSGGPRRELHLGRFTLATIHSHTDNGVDHTVRARCLAQEHLNTTPVNQ